MTILYNAETKLLSPAPEILPDGGLPCFDVYTLVQNDVPSYDAATQDLSPTETIDPPTKTVTRGWKVSAKPTPTPPQPDTNGARKAMAAAFDALPIAVQAAFYTTRVAAESAMDRGRFDIARALIEAQQVPPHLEATKTAILTHFPAS